MEKELSTTPRRRMAGTPPLTTNTEPVGSESAIPARRRMGAPDPSGEEVARTADTTTPVATQSRVLNTAPMKSQAAPRRLGATPAPDPQQNRRMISKTPVKPKPDPEVLTSSSDRSPVTKRALVVAGIVVLGLVVVLSARWLRTLAGVEAFIDQYPGHASQPASAPAGIPGWIGWQHFLNIFFLVLIVRTGLQVRMERRPAGYWTPKQRSFFSPGKKAPKKVPLSQWLHQSLDVLWIINGLIFIVLLLFTGHWMRIVPTSWDIFPNMLSSGLQYASLDWPAEHGWVHYNALQVIAYFTTVFIAAPLAIISGIRFSTWWPTSNEKLTKLYPVEIARAIHFPVMLYFVAFTVVHVFLVLFTGALQNLNHMYTSRDVVDMWGLLIFLGSLAVIAIGWVLTGPLFMRPIAELHGKVTKN